MNAQLVQGALAAQLRGPVVADKHHQRVGSQPALLQLGEHFAEDAVHARDFIVVAREILPDQSRVRT